jgi:hypothetical protein
MHNASSLELKRFNSMYYPQLSQAMKHESNLAWRFRRTPPSPYPFCGLRNKELQPW